MPEGVNLSVPATQFRITTKKKSEWLTLREISQYQSLGTLRRPEIVPLPIKDQLLLPGKKSRTFFLTFPINVDQADEFVLIFPRLLANEKKI